MRTLIYSDPHIQESTIDELRVVYDEIFSYNADSIICLGDYFDRKNISPRELNFGTSIARKKKDIYKEVYMIQGNHDKETVEYLNYLGITVSNTLVYNNNFFGHFFVSESNKAFNSGKETISKYNDYSNVFLGHQHNFQELKENSFHIGSIIWVDFGEIQDKDKFIAIIENNKPNFIKLKSPIKMIEVSDLNTLKSLEGEIVKVRYVYNSFQQLKEESEIVNTYKDKFFLFKTKLNFTSIDSTVKTETKQDSFIVSAYKWIDNLSDNEVKKELRDSFNLCR